MAENESLDLGSSYAKRWDLPFAAFQRGEACAKVVARKFAKALYSGLRAAFKQLSKQGVTPSDLLDACKGGGQSRQLLRRTGGHPYVQLFVAACEASRPDAHECFREWTYAIIDKVLNQIGLRVAMTDQPRSCFDIEQMAEEVRQRLAPDVEHIATNLVKNPDWRPQRKPGTAKAEDAASPTAELMPLSLRGKQP
jgi:hypothetical protein